MVEYMSPERLAGEPYSFEADLWSFGVILYRMAVGQVSDFDHVHLQKAKLAYSAPI